MAVLTFVFDLDGVVYRGNDPVPGAADTIQHLKQLGHQVYYFTNNSTQTRTAFAEKLNRMNIPADDAHIMTSAYATALYLARKNAQCHTVLVVGENGPRVELKAIGMEVVEDSVNKKVDYVVVGLDRTFNYEKMMHAQQAILHGAEFIATNKDNTLPLEGGLVVPGAGCMVAAIQTATGKTPLIIGKPETTAMLELLELAHAAPEDTIVIGDRLETDILAGKRVGSRTVLTLTGITTREQVDSAPPEAQPNLVVADLTEMVEKLGLDS